MRANRHIETSPEVEPSVSQRVGRPGEATSTVAGARGRGVATVLLDLALAVALACVMVLAWRVGQPREPHLAFTIGGLGVALVSWIADPRRRAVYIGGLSAATFVDFMLLGLGPVSSTVVAAFSAAAYLLLVRQVRTRVDVDLDTTRSVLALVGVGGVAGLLQLAGTAALMWHLGTFAESWRLDDLVRQVLAAALGVVLLVPPFLLGTRRASWRLPARRELPMAIGSAAGAIVVTAAVTLSGPWPDLPALIVLCMPGLLLLAVSAPPLWLALVMPVTSALTAIGSLLQRGPLPVKVDLVGTPLDFINLQLMILIALVLSWLIHAAITHQRNLMSSIREQVREQRALNEHLRSEIEQRQAIAQDLRTVSERFGAAVMNSRVAMGFGPLTEGFADFNDAMCDFYGVTREQLQSARWTDFMDDTYAAENVRMQQHLAAGSIDSFELLQRIITPGGMRKWGRVTATAVRGQDGGQDWAIAQIVDVTREIDAQHELQHLVDHDRVTGLFSRAWMVARVDERLQRSDGIAIMFIELAPFLVVYRAHGFEAGDRVLRELGARVAVCLPEGALLGRFEGMTLIAMLPAGVRDLEALCEEILRAVTEELAIAGRRISRTGNIGVAIARPGATTVSLIQDADQALLRAELLGRSRWHIAGLNGAEDEPLEPVELEHELRNALDDGRFIVYFQPQVRLADRVVCGYEALVRWQHPERGLLGPGAFMATMESSGLISRMGRQVLGLVCDRIRATPHLPGPVSVNVSAIELDDADWLANVLDTIRVSGIDPRMLVLELTETAAFDLTGRARDALQRLRDLGVGIHIDDFGTGYTSVGTLIGLPVTAIKLDMSFAAPLRDPEPADVALVRAIAVLAASLGLETIAEGIEDEVQARILQDAGWSIGQGYLFGRPGPGLGA